MVFIKRMHTFMLQQFLPLLAMTFFICLFIVLMQFLWRYIDDLVGKGLSISVIAELFFYAALTMVPTALPLAVLLASLMTFGNLGEKFELTAMKAAGISLFRIMKPLIIFMTFVAIGAFLFQNYALPVAQTKMWTLLFSMRQKSPEVEIPERTFYDQIPGMNLYVDKKNPETGMLYNLIIYDMSRGMDNSRVILADSGKMNFTEDKTRLFLHLYQGEMFENLRDNAMGNSSSNYMPFRRENFSDKQLYFIFDANFNRMDESVMRDQYIGKNVAQLNASIDSIQAIVDSIGDIYASDIKNRAYVDIVPAAQHTPPPSTGPAAARLRSAHEYNAAYSRENQLIVNASNLDSLFAGNSPTQQRMYASQALAKAKRQQQDYEFRSTMLLEQAKLMRRHGIELQRKYTLPFACLIFFFIGAPLGAIIKKGGIGTPLVISVFLFIIYYIFDNMGYKLARDGKVEVWMGIWLSSVVMLPLGIFFTYKAVGDSAVFNMDAYTNFFRRLTGRRMKRSLALKEVVLEEVDPSRAEEMLDVVENLAKEKQEQGKRPFIERIIHPADYEPLNTAITYLVDYMCNTRDNKVVAYLNRLPFSVNRRDLPTVLSTVQSIRERLSAT